MKPQAVEPIVLECEVCLKEVPASEAHIAEAEEYIVHFCGLECYRKWRQSRQPDAVTGDNGPPDD